MDEYKAPETTQKAAVTQDAIDDKLSKLQGLLKLAKNKWRWLYL